jgi:hypothetical protein
MTGQPEPEQHRPFSDPTLRARWQQAAAERLRLERAYRDPELTFLLDEARARIVAAGHDLADGRWRPGPAAQGVLRYVWSVYRAPLPEDDETQDGPDPKRDGRGGAAHAAAMTRELRPVLATGAGEEADRHYHLTALFELYHYAGCLYDGAGYERAGTVSERLYPVEIAAVYLWSAATGQQPGE